MINKVKRIEQIGFELEEVIKSLQSDYSNSRYENVIKELLKIRIRLSECFIELYRDDL